MGWGEEHTAGCDRCRDALVITAEDIKPVVASTLDHSFVITTNGISIVRTRTLDELFDHYRSPRAPNAVDAAPDFARQTAVGP
jgi:hypothetical protein